mmetsp:Transcript_32277/g.67623  ORF Transcript_32277/g.67623 Transcript_32277/m.67623 type:complete len:81 (+) Transcript_32277:116-358(+)
MVMDSHMVLVQVQLVLRPFRVQEVEGTPTENEVSKFSCPVCDAGKYAENVEVVSAFNELEREREDPSSRLHDRVPPWTTS